MLSPGDSGPPPLKNSTLALAIPGVVLALAGLLGALASGDGSVLIMAVVGVSLIGLGYYVQTRPPKDQAIMPLEETGEITAPPRRRLPQIPWNRIQNVVWPIFLAILLTYADNEILGGIGVLVLTLAVLALGLTRRAEIERIVVGAIVAHNAVHPSQEELQRLRVYVAALREVLVEHNIDIPPLDLVGEEPEDLTPFRRRVNGE